jgi:hypothetical protein
VQQDVHTSLPQKCFSSLYSDNDFSASFRLVASVFGCHFIWF